MTDESATPSPPLSPPSEYDKQIWHEAERAHDALAKGIELHFRQIEAFAVLGIRTLALAAAGELPQRLVSTVLIFPIYRKLRALRER